MLRKWWLSSFLVIAGWTCSIPTAGAQDALLGELYGRGVHAYFAHDYQASYDALSEAVKSGSKDPRVYYFRGLSESKLGRPDEAAEDYRLGAYHEIAGGSIVNVGRALERVQGAERLEVESARRKARMTVHNEAQIRAKNRYEQRQTDESKILRDPTRKPVAPAALPVKPDANDPFSGTPNTKGPAAPALPPAAEVTPAVPATPPAVPATPPAVKPVAPAVPVPETKPAGDDPFGGAAAEEAPAEVPAETKPETKPASDDPFGGADEEKPAAEEEKPAEEAPVAEEEKPAEEMPAEEKPAGDDPFGGADEEKPAEEMPAEEAPAAEEEKTEEAPAAEEEKPADEKKPDADDPFGAVAPAAEKPVAKAPTGKGSIWGTLVRAAKNSVPSVGNVSKFGPAGLGGAPKVQAAGPVVETPEEAMETEVEVAEDAAAPAKPDSEVDPFADDEPAVKPASATSPVKEKEAETKADDEAFDPFK